VKIFDRIHIIASGRLGFGLTDDFDCHVYLINGGSEYALIDAGGGRDVDGIVDQITGDGLDPGRVRQLLLTHGHADHAAGAAPLRQRFGLRVAASPTVARYVREGDEHAVSLDVARQAGGYPPEFTFPPCPVDTELDDGAQVSVGDLTLTGLNTPGHASGHIAYVLRQGDRVSVFCGDAVFFGGTILLQHTWDCSLQESIRSVERLAALSVDGLFPGHLTFAVRHGRRQVDKAIQSIANLLPPAQMA
jgi:hydroxyacylglutathione hydrolase